MDDHSIRHFETRTVFFSYQENHVYIDMHFFEIYKNDEIERYRF